MISKAEIYDLIYSYKDYEADSKALMKILAAHNLSGGKDLLDVACGTGEHIVQLKEMYQIEGLDLSADQTGSGKTKESRDHFP